MRLILLIISFFIGIYFFNHVIENYELNSISIFSLVIGFYLTLIFVGVNFNFKSLWGCLKTKFNFQYKIFVLGSIGIIGLLLLGHSLQIYILNTNPKHPINLLSFSLYIIFFLILNSAFEELFFRKFLIKRLNSKYSLVITIRISALIFALGHLFLEGGGVQYFLGLIFGYMFWILNDWFLGFLLHVLFNIFIIIRNEITISVTSLFHINPWLAVVLFILGIVMVWYSISELKKRALST